MLTAELLNELFVSFQLDEYTARSLRFIPPSAQDEVISIAEYLQPDRLLDMVEAAAQDYKVDDLRVAAAVSTKRYHWIVIPGILAMMSLAGIGLDASPENLSFVLKEGELQALWLHNLESTVIYPPRLPFPISEYYSGTIVNSIDELHQFVFSRLFQNNISILIDRVHSLTKVSKKTLWGNAANTCAGTYEMLRVNSNSAAIQADYQALSEQSGSPVMPHRNPLYKLMKREVLNEPGLPHEIEVRSVCCLFTLIPPYTEKCSNCPLLKPAERIALLKAELAEVD